MRNVFLDVSTFKYINGDVMKSLDNDYYKINTEKSKTKTIIFKEKDNKSVEYLNSKSNNYVIINNYYGDIKLLNKDIVSNNVQSVESTLKTGKHKQNPICLTKPIKKTLNIIEDKNNDDITFNDILDLIKLSAILFAIALLIFILI